MKTKIKLDILAQKLGKSITDIAQDTGLNRNTITALYHNKVDGIKFDTIEKICKTYNVTFEEIVGFDTVATQELAIPKKITIQEPYKQDGDIILFTGLPAFIQATKKGGGFNFDIGEHIGYFKKDYGILYWEKSKMNAAADFVYKRYKDKAKIDELFTIFDKAVQPINDLYYARTQEDVMVMSDEDLISFANHVCDLYSGFWKHGIFIDVFDPGYDVEKIEEIKKQHKLTDGEVVQLTTPEQMTFGNERTLKLLEIVKKLSKKKMTKDQLVRFVHTSEEVQEYIKDFDYYRSNYAHVNHITEDETIAEIRQYLSVEWEKEYKKLARYSIDQKKRNSAILKKHKLHHNPLYFFQKLVYWREFRKQINLMGFHLLHYVLYSIEAKTGIPYKFLKHITFDEIPTALKGLVSKRQLEQRYNEGVLLSTIGGHLRILEGKEAQSISNELENRIKGKDDEKIIAGRVACQGYAKGIARIILGQEDFARFKEGEILVTGMTRPEFVPLMKKAAAIVTNEGGITCHAAIVSRELGKPCIIGTQKATQIIKDGDLVEVRANHGTVRILS